MSAIGKPGAPCIHERAKSRDHSIKLLDVRRRRGWTYKRIATVFGISQTRCWQRIQDALEWESGHGPKRK